MKRLEEMDMMMPKDSDKEMDDKSISAKMETLMELLQMAQKEMGHKVKGGMDELLKPKEEMSKVSVMAEDEEGLEEGLDKAKELLSQLPEEAKEEKSEEPEMEASSEEEDEDEGGLFSKRHAEKKKKKSFFSEE